MQNFADDRVLIAYDKEDFSFILRKVDEEGETRNISLKIEYLVRKEKKANLEIEERQDMKGTDKF